MTPDYFLSAPDGDLQATNRTPPHCKQMLEEMEANPVQEEEPIGGGLKEANGGRGASV